MKRGTLQNIKRGWLLFYAHLREHWKGRYGLRGCVVVKGILPCVGCVGNLGTNLDISSRGIHSYVVELTILAIIPLHFLINIINTIVDWIG